MAVACRRQGERIDDWYDWGLRFQALRSAVPSSTSAKAHINVVKVWVPEVGQKIDMVGFPHIEEALRRLAVSALACALTAGLVLVRPAGGLLLFAGGKFLNIF